MIERALTHKLITLSQKFQVITLTGPRQSGKTTLVKVAFPSLRVILIAGISGDRGYVVYGEDR